MRTANEDSFFIGSHLVVADGMGGQAAGALASALAVDTLRSLDGFEAERLSSDALVVAVARADARIREHAAHHPAPSTTGTTLAVLAEVIVGGMPHWVVAHVGDSRVYCYRDGVLTQLTLDHSEVAEMVARGEIAPAQARHHSLRNVITRSLGSDDAVPDVLVRPQTGGERFLVCSDGLHSELPDDQIAAVMAAFPGCGCAQALVDAAVAAGGHDNVTVAVVDAPAVPASTSACDPTTTPREELFQQEVPR